MNYDQYSSSNGAVNWYAEGSENHFNPEGVPKDPDKPNEGIRYAKFSYTELPNETEKVWEIINMVRGYARALEGTRMCYEQHNKYGGKYVLIVPKMDSHAISALEELGVHVTRGYKVLSRKYRRKHYQKIRL